MRIFVSHSSVDKAFVRKLCLDLQRGGHVVFFDEWVIAAGENITTKISVGLEQADRLVLVLTKAAVQSGWVDEEWKAVHWEQIARKQLRIIPVLAESCNIPILLRNKRYVDFTKDYETGLADLLENLCSPRHDPFESLPDEGVPPAAIAMLPRLSPAAAQLADCMSDISEKCWCASWLGGLEYTLWHAVAEGPQSFGTGNVTAAQIELLKALSEMCGGWVIFDDEAPSGASPRKWIPLEKWKSHYADPDLHPLTGAAFADPHADGQRRLLYGFVDDSKRSSWKREALFFDKIVLPDLTWELDPEGWHHTGPHIWDENQPIGGAQAILDLVRKGIIIPSAATPCTEGNMEEAIEAEAQKFGWNSVEYVALRARLQAMKFARTHGVEAYPLYNSLRGFSAGLKAGRESVLRVVFANIPKPMDSVSWDEIIAYRLDPESRRRFAALRVWINRAISGRIPVVEVIEELEHLTAEFEAHMRRHRMAYELKPFESVVAERSDIVRDIQQRYAPAAVKAGIIMQAASGVHFGEEELTAPGRELAYISATRKRFAR